MSTRNVSGSNSDPKLPVPSFALAPISKVLDKINSITDKNMNEDDSASSSESTPRSLTDRVVVQTPPRAAVRSKWFDSPDDDSKEESDRALSSHTTSLDGTPNDNLFGTPDKAVQNATPDTSEAAESLKQLMVENEPGDHLTRREQDSFDAAMRKANNWKSPHKAKDEVKKWFGSALERSGATTRISSDKHAKRALFSSNTPIDNGATWTTELAQMCKVCILDARHLSDLESKDGGFHICPENHPRDAYVRQRRTSLLTGVWCGKVFDETNPAKIRKEFTSFVPRKMSLQHYQSLIALAIDNDSCKIAQQNNRRLYRIDDTDNSFVIECYFQEEGTRIRSAIPVFHYEVYNGTDTSFTVRYSYKHSLEEGNPVFLYNFEVVYWQLFELLETCPEAMTYEMDDKIVVDIGKLYNSNPKYGRCPIEQGVLVEIPKKLL